MATLCLCDSRGRYLEDALLELLHPGEHVEVIFYPGIGLGGLKEKVRLYTSSHVVTSIYILAGINDITRRDRQTRECYMPFQDPQELCDHVTDRVVDLIEFCVRNCGIYDVVMIPLTGLNLNQYNRLPGYSHNQWIINEGVLKVNEAIITINASCGLHTPMVSRYVHKSTGAGRRIRHLYNRLWDGLHPRGDTIVRWAENIIHAIRRNGHVNAY